MNAALILTALMFLPILRAHAEGPLATEIERVKGFDEYQKFLSDFDKEREAASGEVTQDRIEWKKQSEAALPEYKADKASQAKTVTETSPEYFEDLKEKDVYKKELAKEAEQYSAEKNRERAAFVNILSESKEYGLDHDNSRVDWRKRPMYANGGAMMPRPGGGNGRSGGFTRPPEPPEGQNYTSPPPPPPPTQNGLEGGNSSPDFFEPDIPPPPPPPEGNYDEDVPPPIFDEPEF